MDEEIKDGNLMRTIPMIKVSKPKKITKEILIMKKILKMKKIPKKRFQSQRRPRKGNKKI